MNQEVEQEIVEIEVSVKEAKETVALAKALERLHKNKDFKKVFLDYFLGSDVSRVVKCLAAPAFQTDSAQRGLNIRLTAVGELDQFMRSTFQLGHEASLAIEGYEETLVEILAEDQE